MQLMKSHQQSSDHIDNDAVSLADIDPECELFTHQEKATQCQLKPKFRSVGTDIFICGHFYFFELYFEIISFWYRSFTGIQVDLSTTAASINKVHVSTQCDSFHPFTSTPECSPIKNAATAQNKDEDYMPVPHPCSDSEDEVPEESMKFVHNCTTTTNSCIPAYKLYFPPSGHLVRMKRWPPRMKTNS